MKFVVGIDSFALSKVRREMAFQVDVANGVFNTLIFNILKALFPPIRHLEIINTAIPLNDQRSMR